MITRNDPYRIPSIEPETPQNDLFDSPVVSMVEFKGALYAASGRRIYRWSELHKVWRPMPVEPLKETGSQ